MPDDPFLTKLRGGAPAAEDPFLAKVRGGGDDPFLAKMRTQEPAPLAQPAKHKFGFYSATPEETARATAPLDNPPAGVTPPVERMKQEWNAYDQEVGGAAKSADEAMGNLARGEILHDPVGTVRDVGRVAGAVVAPFTALANRVLQPGGSETERKIIWGLRTPLDAPGAAIHDLSPALGEKGAEALVSGAMLAAPFVKGLAKGGLESIRRIGNGGAPDISTPPTFDIPKAAESVKPVEHPNAEVLRRVAEDYSPADFQGKATREGFLRVAAGEPIEKVAADIREQGKGQPAMPPEQWKQAMGDEPVPDLGETAASHFESNVKVALGKAEQGGGAIVKPAEAPPSPFERRMQRGPQPRSSLDEANPTGDLAADIPAMRASKLWDDPNYAPYGRDPKTGKRLTSDPHALDEAAWRAANEPDFAEPRFGEADPYPEATKKLVIREAEEAAASPSPPPASNKPVVDRLNPILDRLESSRLKKEMIEQGHDVTAAEGGGLQYRRPPPASGQAPAARVPEIVNPEVATKRAVVEGVPKWQGGGEVTTQAIDARSQAIREAIKNVRAVDRYGNPERPSGLLNAALAGDDLSGAMWIENLDRATPREITKQYVDAVRAAVPDATFADMKFALTGKAPKVQAAAPHAELPAPAAPSAPDVPAAPASPDPSPAGGAAVPPREGPTLGVGLGALGKKPEGWIEAIEEPYARTIGKGVAKVVDPALNLFKSPEAKISPEFEKAVQEGRSTERGLSADAKRAVSKYERATKGISPEQNKQIGRSLSSEDADLSGLTAEQRAAVEDLRGSVQDIRSKELASSSPFSKEVFEEYPQGHLKRVVKPGLITERRVARAGGVTVKAYQTAKDMFGIKVDLPAEEARSLVPPGSPLRYLKQEGRSTLLKFTNSPEGMKARDAFFESLKSRFADARSRLGADATREMRAAGDPREVRRLLEEQETIPTEKEALELGASPEEAKKHTFARLGVGAKAKAEMNTVDVREVKQFARAQADVPRVGDLGVEKFDPIPEDVADRIFVKDTAQRAHVTLQESARRIGKAETLKNISEVVDSKGPVAIEPPTPGADTPEGYTLVDNKAFGPLNRKFVRNDVLEYVKGAFDPQQKHFLTEFGDGLMERFKTVRLLDPRMVPRQLVSNMEFENLAGMSNWNPRYLQWKAKGLAAMREGSPYRAALERNGFLHSGVVTEAEIGLAESALAESGSVGKRIGRAVGSFGLTELAPKMLKRVESAGWKAYSSMDAWTKSTIYVHAIEELGMSPADAAAYVRKWTPSPESVATWVQGYSRHLVGDPWARYRAEMARINLQAIKEKPIRLAMNRLQKDIIRGVAIGAGASLLSSDEKKALENEQGGGAVALGRDAEGRPLALNYTFLSTLGDFFSQPKTVGKPWKDATDTFLRWSGLGDNPLYSTGSQMLTGENAKTGKPINPEGTIEGGLKSFAALAASQWTPSMLSSHAAKLNAAWNDEPYSPNQPKQTKEQAVLDVFFGFKLTPLDAQQALQKIARQGARAYDDIASNFRGKAMRGETIDPENARKLADMLAKDYSERAAPLNRISAEQAQRRIGSGKP